MSGDTYVRKLAARAQGASLKREARDPRPASGR